MTTKTALILDDDHVCRNMLTDMLTLKEVRVTAHSDPLSYMTHTDQERCAMQEHCFNFILTDNQMPGMTGLEFLEKIKKKGCKIPDNRKAIISGTWSNEELMKARNLGCRTFIKPCPIEQIHNWLDEP